MEFVRSKEFLRAYDKPLDGIAKVVLTREGHQAGPAICNGVHTGALSLGR